MSEFTIDKDQMVDFLNEKARQYEQSAFISDDPISIPHRFSERGDIEVSAFLAAAISWGKRSMIIRSANQMMDMLDHEPYNFVMNASDKEIEMLGSFYYRTFKGVDLVAFVKGLRKVYNQGGLEHFFASGGSSTREGIMAFRSFFIQDMPQRTLKHLSDVGGGSAGKRFNMFLRWMVRPSSNGVDFGIWTKMSPSQLYLPLDVHSARVARSLGLLQRRQNDWKAVAEVTESLRMLDPLDPVKYDFALFGLGIFENFAPDGQ
jgi:uncharacterized protein (TIGR02757 family)